MNYSDVKNSIMRVKNLLAPFLLGSPVSFKDEVEISWGSYKSGILSKESYLREYFELVNNSQFSFLLMDGSFFQFYFRFENEELKSARCAYYPKPEVVSEEIIDSYLEYAADETSELSLLEMALDDSNVYLTNTSHLRVDYDSSTDAHCVSHLQYGGHNSLRICSDHVVSPLVFVSTVINSEIDLWQKTFTDEYLGGQLSQLKNNLKEPVNNSV